MWFVRGNVQWSEEPPYIGVGETPEKALEDLESQCNPNPDTLEWWQGYPCQFKITRILKPVYLKTGEHPPEIRVHSK